MEANKQSKNSNINTTNPNSLKFTSPKEHQTQVNDDSFDSFLDIDEHHEKTLNEKTYLRNTEIMNKFKNIEAFASENEDDTHFFHQVSNIRDNTTIKSNQFKYQDNEFQINDIPAINENAAFKNFTYIDVKVNGDKINEIVYAERQPRMNSDSSNVEPDLKQNEASNNGTVRNELSPTVIIEKMLQENIVQPNKNSTNAEETYLLDKNTAENEKKKIDMVNDKFILDKEDEINFTHYGKINESKLKEVSSLDCDIAFEKDISAIWPTDDKLTLSRINNNCHFIEQSMKLAKKVNRDIQKFEMLNNVSKDQSNSPNETINDEVSEKLSQTIMEHPRFNEIEDKLENLTQIFIENIDDLKKEVQTVRQLDEKKEEIKNSIHVQSNIKAQHVSVFCNNCKTKDFIGKRYNCLECTGFNLCETCEAKTEHSHPMIRIIVPDIQETFNDLNNLYNIKQKLINSSEEDVKERFLRSLTGNKYANAVYKNLIRTHMHLKAEDFILEMTKIFG